MAWYCREVDSSAIEPATAIKKTTVSVSNLAGSQAEVHVCGMKRPHWLQTVVLACSSTCSQVWGEQ